MSGLSSSSSAASDAHLGSSSVFDDDLDERGDGRKLNYGVLGRSTSSCRRTGSCEGKLQWPGASDNRVFHDQDTGLLIRTFPNSIGYSEGLFRVDSSTQQCIDGAYEQSECINTAPKDGHESEDDGVENDERSEEHSQGEQPGDEESHGQVSQIDHHADRGLDDEEEGAREEFIKEGLTVSTSQRTQFSRVDQKRRSGGQFVESKLAVGSTAEQLGSSQVGSRSRFEPANHFDRGGVRGSKELQLAERGSSSQEYFGKGLDVVGPRGEERGVLQKRLSGSWARDDLRGGLELQEQNLSFQGEDTVECITNVGEEDDFGFVDVDEFETSPHPGSQAQKAEPIQETHHQTERRKFQSRRGEAPQASQGSQDRQNVTTGAKFESPQSQGQVTDQSKQISRARAGSQHHLRPSKQELEESQPGPPVDAGAASHKIPEKVESGSSARVGKGQEKEDKLHPRVEGHQRKSEVSEERRVRGRLDGSAAVGAGSGKGEETEEAIKVAAVRPSRPSGGKDRHSKVNTAKGPRDRRVRLSVPTAVQFYDVQDRLGYDQPSKAVEWLIKKAKAAIDELGRLPVRGNELGGAPATTAMSDVTHASPFSSSLSGPLSSSSTCPSGSFSAALSSSPFGDVGNHMGYFFDSSIPQGMSYANHHGLHGRDMGGMGGLSQTHLPTGQGHFASLIFPLGQTDLSRGNAGPSSEGGKMSEFGGSPLPRMESRLKARERARERVQKEKCSGPRDGAAGGCSSPSSMQSPPPLHQHPIHGPFNIQSLQSSLQSPSPHQSPLQSSLSSVFHTTLSGIMQSSQQGTLQNLLMQNPSLQSSLTDQVQNSLQHTFQPPLQSTLQSSQSLTSLQNSGMQQQQQQSHLQNLPSLQGSTHGLGSGGFTPGPCSSSFSEASLSSSHYMSVSSLPISQPISLSQLSAQLGMSGPPSSMGGSHFPTATTPVQIPAGFSPGPPASAFRPRPMPITQGSSHQDQQQQQGPVSRPQQLILPSYNAASGSPTGSSSSKASPPLYYSAASSRMGSNLHEQSISPIQALTSPSFSSIRNVSYDFQRGLQSMMSPDRRTTGTASYQSSSSQIPARIQGFDDYESELKSPSPDNSPHHVHP